MKKIFFTLFFLSICAVFFPPRTSAQITTLNCGTNVTYNNSTGEVLGGVSVYIYVQGFDLSQDPCFLQDHPLAGAGNPIAVSNPQADDGIPDGEWRYECDSWPNDWLIERVEFIRSGYQTTASFRNPPDFNCQTGEIRMTKIPNDGWRCNNSTGNCEFGVNGLFDGSSICSIYCGAYVIPPTIGNGPFCTTASGIQGINTAIGCVPYTNITEFSAFIIKWGMGVGGGIGFIMIVFSSFIIITSGGDPAKLKAGKELLTAAVSGLSLIIFSIFILEMFGLRILMLPGFGN
ncbi:hypothetical protein A2Z22_02805 [Candidatus Woesebacteria bacterium RBG_16_34_12]|uniref:Uncharacterized protein n=1 Tax=Candidatus Woesebacteria bacterium RBG_16_34_12 TaxID=1802480 RepID=A0A1F7X739_9BACT|nr:MAG: hypothetical protein A2Z22_02805 [Candidatus Woesebacteria bacterium RBG_16_34_12]